MSIRDELYERYVRLQKEKEEEKKNATLNYEAEARDFIENSIIPRFRKLADSSPDALIFVISFIRNGMYYNTVDTPTLLIVHEVILAATQLASEYDIDSNIVYEKTGTEEISYISFSLNLC